MNSEFKELTGHKDFKIKKLFDHENNLIGRGDIAEIEPGGGGPFPSHIHEHGHLFIVLKGEVDVSIDNDQFTVHENSSIKVPGNTKHSMINNSKRTSRVLGITVN